MSDGGVATTAYAEAVFGPAVGLGTEPDGEVLRTVSGREAGELLRLHRDPATGMVTAMHWGTYLLTRVQQTFDHVPVSQPLPHPGGSDRPVQDPYDHDLTVLKGRRS